MVKWWQTLLAVAFTFLLAISIRNEFLFFLSGFEVMLIATSVVFVHFQSKHVKLKVVLESQTVLKGETFRVRARLTNKSLLPLTRVYARLAVRVYPEKDELLLTGKVMLAGGEEGDICFELDSSHIQSFDIRPDKLVIEDFIGIARRSLEIEGSDIYTMYIMPKPVMGEVNLPESERTLLEGTGNDIMVGGTDVDVSEIRQYELGDPVKLVHWKLSARLDDIMVRSLVDPAEKYIWIFLNLEEKDASLNKSGKNIKTSGDVAKVRRNPDMWDNFVQTVSAVSLTLLDSGRKHMVCWIRTDMDRAEKLQVYDEASYRGMLMALMRTDTYSSQKHTKLLEEIFSDEAKETCIEIDLQGNTYRSDRA